ncbi:hypothetical protein VTK56DRAFT_7965 [Thermocarpiscus australiensis]
MSQATVTGLSRGYPVSLRVGTPRRPEDAISGRDRSKHLLGFFQTSSRMGSLKVPAVRTVLCHSNSTPHWGLQPHLFI